MNNIVHLIVLISEMTLQSFANPVLIREFNLSSGETRRVIVSKHTIKGVYGGSYGPFVVLNQSGPMWVSDSDVEDRWVGTGRTEYNWGLRTVSSGLMGYLSQKCRNLVEYLESENLDHADIARIMMIYTAIVGENLRPASYEIIGSEIHISASKRVKVVVRILDLDVQEKTSSAGE